MDIFNLKYYIIYSVFAIAAFIFSMYVDIKKKQYNSISRFITVVCFIIIAILFGFRELNIGSDTEMYRWIFLTRSDPDFGIQFCFKYLTLLVYFITNNHQYFLLTISILYISVVLWSINVFLDDFESNFLLIAFAFVSMFFFLALGINIVRQGVSLAFVLLAISYYLKNNKNTIRWTLPFIFAVGFHTATIIILILFIIIVLTKKIKVNYYYVWYFALLIVSAAGGGILSLGPFISVIFIADSRKSDYYLSGGASSDFVVGFKPQFVAFNTIFLIIFSFINYKLLKNENENYKLLLKYYMLMSGVFFMMFQIPFSDRWGVMSWIIIPFMLAPLFDVKNTSKYSIATTAFLIFIFTFFSIYNNK